MTTPQSGNSLVGHAQALQALLADLTTLTVQQLADMFHQYAHHADFPLLLRRAFPEIVDNHAHAAATATAHWYDQLAPQSKFRATPTVDLPIERIAKTADWALYAPTKSGGTAYKTEPDVTLSRLSGSAKRMVFDASRDTTVTNADAEGVKWVRYAQPGACAFCRVLATRPPAYLSKESAQTVVGRGGIPRGSRQIGEKYHDHCRCVGVPIRSGYTWTAPKYVQQWSDDYDQARSDVYDSTEGMTLENILARMRVNTNAK